MTIKKVKIYHAETDQSSEVLESAVPGWETVGWTRVDDESDPKPASPEPVKAKTNGGPAVPDTSKKE